MQLNEKTLERNHIELIAMDEVFTQIPDWNKYYLSNWGRLIHKNNKNKYTIVNPSITDGGYLSYTLSKPARTYRGEKVRDSKTGKLKNRRECKTAQELVATLYVNNPYPAEYAIKDLHVHHKDRNRTNNYYKNLMWLCKTKNGRKDHDFIHSIKRIAIYNEDKGTFYSYKDIELLCKRLNVNILELIDNVKYSDKLFIENQWDIYQVNNYVIGVQFYKNKK